MLTVCQSGGGNYNNLSIKVLSHFSVTILYKYFNGKQNIPQSEKFQNQILKSWVEGKSIPITHKYCT